MNNIFFILMKDEYVISSYDICVNQMKVLSKNQVKKRRKPLVLHFQTDKRNLSITVINLDIFIILLNKKKIMIVIWIDSYNFFYNHIQLIGNVI